MSERKRSRYTPQEKMEIIDEVRKKGSPVSEVCRRHGISVSLFYEWERKVKEATVTSLGGAERTRKRKQRELTLELAKAEIIRLKGIIAEIAEENLKLKKGYWP